METQAGKCDALVLWCTEGNEHQDNMEGATIIQEVLPGYKDVVPQKPMFYAPVNASDMSALYQHQPEGITLITQGEGIQNATWQLKEIRRLAKEQCLTTLELIGHLPVCIDIAGERLGKNGITVTAKYPDGTIKTFRQD